MICSDYRTWCYMERAGLDRKCLGFVDFRFQQPTHEEEGQGTAFGGGRRIKHAVVVVAAPAFVFVVVCPRPNVCVWVRW